MIKKILVKAVFSLFIPRIVKLAFLIKKKRVFIFDIDNTITETGTYLMRTGSLQKRQEVIEMCKDLELDLALKKLIYQIEQRRNTEVIFLTARSYYLYTTTRNWLQSNLDCEKINLIMVMEAKDKYPIVKFFSMFAENLTLIDDLTFGHEMGKVEYHTDLIRELRSLKNLDYVDLEGINQIKRGHKEAVDFFQNKI